MAEITKNEPRLLTPTDIEIRVQSVKKTQNGYGAILLLYKNARVDMAILDEWIGPMNWQRKHTRENANCIISIWDKEKSQWIEKEDTGTESNTEPEKGMASDSFKRAGFNWGIGRELYTAPFIWIDLAETEINNEKLKFNVKFNVKSINYDDSRKITALTITDNRGNVRFTFKAGAKTEPIPDIVTKPQNAPQSTGQPQQQNTPPKPQNTPPKATGVPGDIQITFGKHNGQMLSEVFKSDRQYCDWMLTSDRIKDDIKMAISNFITNDPL